MIFPMLNLKYNEAIPKQLNVLNCAGLFPQSADACISIESLQFVPPQYLPQHLID